MKNWNKLLLVLPIVGLAACDREYQLDKTAFYCDDAGAVFTEEQLDGKDSKLFYVCDKDGNKITGTVGAYDNQKKMSVKDGIVISERMYHEGNLFRECDFYSKITGRLSIYGNCVSEKIYYETGELRSIRSETGFATQYKLYDRDGNLVASEQRWDVVFGRLVRITYYKTNIGPINVDAAASENEGGRLSVTNANAYDDLLRPLPVTGYVEIMDETGEIAQTINVKDGWLDGAAENLKDSPMNSAMFSNYDSAGYKDGKLQSYYKKCPTSCSVWIGDLQQNFSYTEEIMLKIGDNTKRAYYNGLDLVALQCNNDPTSTTETKCKFE